MNNKQKKVNRVLTIEDRKDLERLLHSGINKREIARNLKIHPTTVFREIKRCKDAYNAEEAQFTVGKSHNLLDFDIIGKRFGLLTVQGFASIYNKRSWWHCMCDCGKSCIISRKILTEYCSAKRPLSCGCVPKQWHSKQRQLPQEELALRKFHDLLKYRKITGECWEWTGYRGKGKTPRCSWKNKSMSVRKCMYLIFNGTTYEPNYVYTTCGNLLCFNPDHLTLYSPKKRHYYED
jgi:hypothetical protein